MILDGNVQLEIEGNIATLRLNRPQVRNALCQALLDDMARAIEILEQRDDFAVVLVCGAGKSFCTGADLREMASLSSAQGRMLERQCPELLERMATLPAPIVMALHGHALGGGFLISLYGDVRLAAEGTLFGFPPASTAWMPPWGLSRLATWVGIARAQQILLAGGAFDVARAMQVGLVDQVYTPENLLTAARGYVRRLAILNREVTAEVRAFFAEMRGQSHRHWDNLAAAAFERCLARPAAQQAIDRFLNRSAPTPVTESTPPSDQELL